jgi:hypothetical protein
VSRLEDQATRTHQLVEERSRDLLGRAFSRVFSHLLSLDPDFDFDAAIAPCPGSLITHEYRGSVVALFDK